MGTSFGVVGILSAILSLLAVVGVVALAVVLAMALLTWRRRLEVAIELDRLRIERLVAGTGTTDA